MAILAWAIKEKMFLKLQIGIGDNLNTQEIREGYKNYIIWNTFKPSDLDLDSDWQPSYYDGGLYLSRNRTPSLKKELPAIYNIAFNDTWNEDATIILCEE